MNTNEAYDPKTDTWMERESMPTNRHHLTSAVIRGKMYVIGGKETDKKPSINIGTNEASDPKLNKWNILEYMPTNRSGLSAVSVEDQIYVFGGEYPFDEEPKKTSNKRKFTIQQLILGLRALRYLPQDMDW